MDKITTIVLSSEEMKEAIMAYLKKEKLKVGEVEFVNKKGFFPQTSYEIKITESL